MTPTPESTNNSGRRPAWLLVTIREIVVKVTDKAFIIGTLTTLGIIVAGFAVGFLISGRADTTDVVVTTPEAAAVATAMDTQLQQSGSDDAIVVTELDSADQATSQVMAGDADVYLHHDDSGWVTTWESEPDDTFVSQLTETLRAQTIAELAEQAGVTTAQVEAQTRVDVDLLTVSSTAGPAAYIAAVVFGVLFMMSSMTYGMQIATSVIEEKQSRIVEILVAVIPVRQLLAGKVIGNTLIAFAQVLFLLAAGLIGVAFTPARDFLPDFVTASAWFLIFFLAGFLALACIWAAAGALGTRSEDLNQTSTPLMWLIMAVYLAAFAASGTVRIVLSFVPIVSAVLMPSRLLEGSVSWWEPLLALVANLVFAALMVLLGERIYRRALLRTGGRLNWRQGLTLAD
ncbi:ABC transporter permease [Propionimicrobium sp. PCR01-08-3]|uniref:ABC transporter permease n=1 Tax=Propionimicrobium sp. PCR01-08-3 TaxID=3052086 RepID=UPI00255D14F3|nr:ABC transporter permease [Propionimicrobium sp. PCR01-08-3]WIY83316.1 ABC transporter permease [Propionimicrobium sp. PCR01-08-3]